MAKIMNQKIVDAYRVNGDSNIYTYVIEYDAVFEPHELPHLYDEAAKIWEEDDSDDDQITVYPVPTSFTAVETVEPRTIILNHHADTLDTELGSEETYAWIWLRITGSEGPADDEQRTPVYTVDP